MEGEVMNKLRIKRTNLLEGFLSLYFLNEKFVQLKRLIEDIISVSREIARQTESLTDCFVLVSDRLWALKIHVRSRVSKDCPALVEAVLASLPPSPEPLNLILAREHNDRAERQMQIQRLNLIEQALLTLLKLIILSPELHTECSLVEDRMRAVLAKDPRIDVTSNLAFELGASFYEVGRLKQALGWYFECKLALDRLPSTPLSHRFHVVLNMLPCLSKAEPNKYLEFRTVANEMMLKLGCPDSTVLFYETIARCEFLSGNWYNTCFYLHKLLALISDKDAVMSGRFDRKVYELEGIIADTIQLLLAAIASTTDPVWRKELELAKEAVLTRFISKSIMSLLFKQAALGAADRQLIYEHSFADYVLDMRLNISQAMFAELGSDMLSKLSTLQLQVESTTDEKDVEQLIYSSPFYEALLSHERESFITINKQFFQ